MADDMATTIAAMGASSQKAVLGGEIITQTLDALNSPMYGGSKKNDAMSDTYNLNKSVLSDAYGAKDATDTISAAGQKDTLGGDIITGTLDTLNSSTYSSKKGDAISDMYDLNKSVLSAAYSDKGAIADYSS